MCQSPKPILHFPAALARLFLLNPIPLRSVSPCHPVLFIAAVPSAVKPFALSAGRVISDHVPATNSIGATGLMA